VIAHFTHACGLQEAIKVAMKIIMVNQGVLCKGPSPEFRDCHMAVGSCQLSGALQK